MSASQPGSNTGWLNLLAPLSGPVLPIESVPDPVFAQKIVGPGVAIDPTSESLLAPCDGKIVQLHRAHHALTIELPSGEQILLHIGLDTVKLNGEGFSPRVKLGDSVKTGQELIRFDADLVAQRAKSLVSVMVFTDIKENRLSFPIADQNVVQAGKDVVAKLALAAGKVSAKPAASGDTEARSSEIVIQNLPTGLHARPAALLANMAKSYVSSIEIWKDSKSANAKSVVGIMSLEISPGDHVYFRGEGDDASLAVKALYDYLSQLREQPAADADVVKKAAAQSIKKAPTRANALVGIGVSPGLAIGRIHRVKSETLQFAEASNTTPEKEEATLNRALEQAGSDLKKMMTQVQAKTDAAIFAAHLELLDDPDILTDANRYLAQGKSAAFAWNQAVSEHAERLANLNNELMANRANDLRDVGRRVLRILVRNGGGTNEPNAQTLSPGSILIAESLTPSETVQLDRSKVLGFCTTTGGATSHVAILARSLGLPAIAGIDARALEVEDGTEVVLDGELGELLLRPTAEEKTKAEQVQRLHMERRQEALKLSHEPARTLDQHPVEVAANIGSVADARQAVEMGADGIGLLRSEFLFLERETAPSEEEQLQVYQEIADILGKRTFVIRTLDVGGDKPLKYLPIEAEENPFLGVRGVRVGFLYPEILRQQLRAILRVKSQGKLCVMFPMIASLEEFRKAKAMLEEERARLGTKAAKVDVGIMIEVPSAALAADGLAREADFFSVGTNDLTQYTLAMDRGHKGLAQQVDALHPSVLKLIQLAAQAAHRHGKWIGVCGGLASDLKAVPVLVGLGIDELSVSIPSIPLVKSAVRECRFDDASSLAESSVLAENATAVRNLLTRN